MLKEGLLLTEPLASPFHFKRPSYVLNNLTKLVDYCNGGGVVAGINPKVKIIHPYSWTLQIHPVLRLHICMIRLCCISWQFQLLHLLKPPQVCQPYAESQIWPV